MQGLRSALDTVVDFASHKDSRGEFARSLLRGGAGAAVVAELVRVVGEQGVEAGGCRETGLGALVNVSMAKESRHAMYLTPGLETALLRVLNTAPTGSSTLSLAVKVLRNLSDQGGGDNRALMFKSGLADLLVGIIRRHAQVCMPKEPSKCGERAV